MTNSLPMRDTIWFHGSAKILHTHELPTLKIVRQYSLTEPLRGVIETRDPDLTNATDERVLLGRAQFTGRNAFINWQAFSASAAE